MGNNIGNNNQNMYQQQNRNSYQQQHNDSNNNVYTNNNLYANSQQNANQNVLSPVSQTPANYNMAQNNSPRVVTSPHSITSPLSMHNNHNQHQTGFARTKLPFRNWHSDIPRSQNVQNVNKQSPQTYDDSMTWAQYNQNILSPQSKQNEYFVHNQRQQNVQHKNWLNQSPQNSQFQYPNNQSGNQSVR